jgi:hypothetical protein
MSTAPSVSFQISSGRCRAMDRGLAGLTRAGFSTIRVKVDLATDADPAAVVKLHHQVAATSPVGHSLQAAVPVEITIG